MLTILRRALLFSYIFFWDSQMFVLCHETLWIYIHICIGGFIRIEPVSLSLIVRSSYKRKYIHLQRVEYHCFDVAIARSCNARNSEFRPYRHRAYRTYILFNSVLRSPACREVYAVDLISLGWGETKYRLLLRSILARKGYLLGERHSTFNENAK